MVVNGSNPHLTTSEGWNAELAQQREEVGRSGDMTSTGNRTRVARMVAQWFTYYATAACCQLQLSNVCLFKSKISLIRV